MLSRSQCLSELQSNISMDKIFIDVKNDEKRVPEKKKWWKSKPFNKEDFLMLEKAECKTVCVTVWLDLLLWYYYVKIPIGTGKG